MEAVREVTVWSVEFRQPNHDYLLDGDRVVAYRKWGEGEIIASPSRLKIDRRGRKFVKLDPNPFEALQLNEREKPLVVEVKGSKGQTYFLSNPGGEWHCTCPGFSFRGECKHIKEMV
jgi:hypothetical protein